MEKIFAGKTAIVTGASYGIGRATAVMFAIRGANVVLADWIEDPAHETVDAIKAAGGSCVFVKCDVSKSEDVDRLVQKTIDTYGRLDFAFNNAGVEGINAVAHECSEDNWDRTIAINLKGVWLCMRAQIPHMLRNGSGVIVNCASIAGLRGFSGLPAYVASKHGVVGLTKAAALDYAAKGLRINVVCPGVIHTPMVDRVTHGDPGVEKQYAAMEPLGRMGKPEEIADAVMWLCADGAAFVTGVALPVDGGYVAK
jgi:NAD(P)-dependent dehydrogenase (short-subunit alcohol dehydrogenase family)